MKAQLSFIALLLMSASALGQSSNPCSGLWFGEIVANPNRCDAFYTCILTIPTPVECGNNQVFDPAKKQCVPGNPETCEIYGTETTTTQQPSTPTPLTTTPTPPTTTTRPPLNLDEICRGVFFAARPHPYSEILFVGCIRGGGVLFQCNENEWFNPSINECSDTLPISTPSSTSTPSLTTVTVTFTDTTFPQTIQPTTFAPTTTTTPEPTTTRIIQTTLAPNLEDICEGKFFEYIAHPTACSLFIFCYDEMEFVRQCPEFQIFDEADRVCRWGNQETCVFIDGNTNTPTEPTEPTTVATEPSTIAAFNPCEGITNGVVAAENDCTFYYRCIMERFTVARCAEGQIFIAERGFCVNGNPETCVAAQP